MRRKSLRGTPAPRPRRSLTRPDPLPLRTDPPTVLWTLRNGHSRVECSVQLLRHGLQLQLYLALNSDTPYFSRIFHTPDELLAWAEETRVQTLAEGWN